MFFVKCQIAAITIATAFFTAPLTSTPYAYNSNQLDNSVSIIDAGQGKVVDTVKVQGKPAGIAVAPAGDKIYVSTPEAKGFAVIDVKKREVIAKVAVSDGALGIAIGTDGKRI